MGRNVLRTRRSGMDTNGKIGHSVLGPVELDRALALYAWHGRHHVAHITRLRLREGW
jgi:hypothetical protein